MIKIFKYLNEFTTDAGERILLIFLILLILLTNVGKKRLGESEPPYQSEEPSYKIPTNP